MNVFVTGPGTPDREFPTLAALGRHIADLRTAIAGAPELALTPATLWRDPDLPGCAAISVRALDGQGLGGKGALLGYALVETPAAGAMPDMVKRLMLAIIAADARPAHPQDIEAGPVPLGVAA